MKAMVHACAGTAGMLTILVFLTSTVSVELFGSHDAIATVKTSILWGLLVLIPALAITGASGVSLAGRRSDPSVITKKKRMRWIAGLGILVLVPCGFFLASKAANGQFDLWFDLVQVIELLAGAANLTLVSLNLRDGLRLRTARRSGRLQARSL